MVRFFEGYYYFFAPLAFDVETITYYFLFIFVVLKSPPLYSVIIESNIKDYITFFFILCSINLNTCEYVPCEYASHRQSLYLLKTFVQLSIIVLTKRAEMHCTDCLQRI